MRVQVLVVQEASCPAPPMRAQVTVSQEASCPDPPMRAQVPVSQESSCPAPPMRAPVPVSQETSCLAPPMRAPVLVSQETRCQDLQRECVSVTSLMDQHILTISFFGTIQTHLASFYTPMKLIPATQLAQQKGSTRY